MRLDTRESRTETLATHINHRIWDDAPYISFTNCANALQNLADYRTKRQGDQWVVVTDPRIRFDSSLDCQS